MILSSILNTAQICAQLDLKQVVLSPGSRSAPLTLAFVRHPDITTRIVSDERSAAFIGLGIAQQLRQPVGLVCTSGSAAYNYAPAVAEAFFRHVPLVVFTADRPPEWIDQLDGQTIRQRGLYGAHVKQSYELPVGQTEADVWHAGRIVSEAVNLSRAYPAGPVHLNVPVREPFYPEAEPMSFDQNVKVIKTVPSRSYLPEANLQALAEDWERYETRLLVGGQGSLDTDLVTALNELSEAQQAPVVADVISNLHPLPSAVRHADVLLAHPSDELSPDLLITFGLSVLSKHLKLFLRKHRPRAHWHIQPAGVAADTYRSLTQVIYTHPTDFFRQIAPRLAPPTTPQTAYAQRWRDRESKSNQVINGVFDSELAVGEFRAVRTILEHLPNASNLHLANSMTVRYVNLIGLSDQHHQVTVFANRGTSGIDGSSSTAVGASLVSDRLTVLLTGDLAFFYDRNAFWHNYPLPHLRIVLLNNHGGGIFRLIDGPSQQPEREEYFETQQPLTAERTAQDFGMQYHRIDLTGTDTLGQLEDYLPTFYGGVNEHASLLEIVTDPLTNQEVYRRYRQLAAKKH